MNYTARVTITCRTITGNDSGVPSITPVAVLTDAPCAISPLSAARVTEAFGQGADVDVSREYRFLYLPTWLATLPAPGRALTDYRFSLTGDEWQAQAVVHDDEHSRFLLWRTNP